MRRWLLGVALALSSTAGAGCSCGDGTMPPGTDGGDAGALDALPPGDAPLPDAPLPDAPPDAFVPECTAAADCMTLHGPPPCGTWDCTGGLCVANCPGCTDADGDGYGTGAPGTCAGPDCDDTDRSIGDSGSRSCYSGPP